MDMRGRYLNNLFENNKLVFGGNDLNGLVDVRMDSNLPGPF